jgi:hypothetical protein
MNADMLPRWIGSVTLAVVLTLAAGCSSENPIGTVAGKISFNGKPVVAGNVNFRSAKGVGAQAEIEDGTYRVDGSLPVGEYSVFVNPPLPEPQPPGKPAAAPMAFEVPQKFQDAGTSDLKVTVKGGKNDIPVDING